MARAQTMVQLTEQLVELLDEEATRRGISRSALIREAVGAYLASAQESKITQAIVEGYRRVPPGRPDSWGDLQSLGDLSNLELLQRLDAEERASGGEVW